jgi:DNA-binding transcriptional LysR family regulator
MGEVSWQELPGGMLDRIVRHKSDWSDLHVFHAIAVSGGLNAAARALRIDPSTVSRTLDQLEARLNTKLVRRTPQGITLTPAGERALLKVRTMEHLVADLERDIIDAEAGHPEGVVTISCSDAIGAYVLTPSLPSLLRENPKLDIGLDCGLWPDDPLTIDAEIALVYDAQPVAGYVTRTIAHVHYGLFGSKSFLKLYGAPTTVEEALRHPYLHHTAQRHTSGMARSIPDFQDLARRRLQTNSSAAVVEGVIAGTGLAALPTFLAATYPDLVMLSPPLPPICLSLVYHNDVARQPRIKTVLGWLEATFDASSHPWFRQEFTAPKDYFAHKSTGTEARPASDRKTAHALLQESLSASQG